MAVQGNYAYVGEGPTSTILNVTNPAAPLVVGKTSSLSDRALAGTSAYVAVGNERLRIIDASNSIAPTETGYYSTSGFASAVTVDGNYTTLTSPNGRVG